jgi:acetolactate synthase-1/2/3 large subunit
VINDAAGSAAIVAALADAGTRVMFGLPGGGPNLGVISAAHEAGLRFVLAHTETAAVIMAASYADLTGRPGAAVVTRGPGLASAVNGIAHAALDRLPVVVIADTVPKADAPRISHQRMDQAALGRAVAKAVITLGRDRTAEVARQAVTEACTPPPGPVITLMDDSDDSAPSDPPRPRPDSATCGRHDVPVLATALRRSRRPLVMLGTGAIPHTQAIRAALEGSGIPALHTYRARGVIPDHVPEAAGLVTGGTMEWPLLAAADLIIALGVDEAELIPAPWDHDAPVLRIAPPDRQSPAYFPEATALDIRLPEAIGMLAENRHDWPEDAGRTAKTRVAQRLNQACPHNANGRLTPVQLVKTTRELAPPDTITTVDAGAHMLAVMPLWEVTEPKRLLISSGLATMGYALPAAIAAALCEPSKEPSKGPGKEPGKLVIAFTGDGGLAMTLAEIETAVRLNLRIAVVVFNDATLSLIKIKQNKQTNSGPDAVDFAPVSYARAAEAMGAAAATVRSEEDLAAALEKSANRDGPTIIDAHVDPGGYPAIMDLTRGEAGRKGAPLWPSP